MAHPKHRISKQRRNKRRTHDKATVPAIAKCSNCGAAVQYHTVCPECGYYRGKLAIEKAVVAVDACVKDTVEAAKANGYEVIIIADHGNADNAVNADGTPNTAHSLNPVPCVYVTENKDARISDGILADVAPSVLHIMGMDQPSEMTGKNLIK